VFPHGKKALFPHCCSTSRTQIHTGYAKATVFALTGADFAESDNCKVLKLKDYGGQLSTHVPYPLHLVQLTVTFGITVILPLCAKLTLHELDQVVLRLLFSKFS
jgi:hypothetical protein